MYLFFAAKLYKYKIDGYNYPNRRPNRSEKNEIFGKQFIMLPNYYAIEKYED